MQVDKVKILKVRENGESLEEDYVAVEEPLEIKICEEECRTFAVIMRTPGQDEELSLGFLFSEGVIDNSKDVREITAGDGEVRVYLTRRAEIEPRHIVVNSSCGVCGRRLLYTLEILKSEVKVEKRAILSFPRKLREYQSAFNVTGGLHAAALLDTSGDLVAISEDVGRHNAVDKVVGSLLREDRLPASQYVLQVSGRVGYEIVSKAVMAGIPIVSGISAPTSYAVEIAKKSGVTLIGFLRDGYFNVYAHGERLI
ncbi:formate dehydrogenase accessory sulfurtransferase FdhD [Metallosphaera tengchongensis]|uniref:Sulfur carrier protein FdhD n=1 Tax=Metallosphaera tengchongensis TaxID=1532350 RepID=A0A6N0NV52_9CREN|nr:formate dehydrogenase accessory sulfurtransferase FdhD [Metallosphaera tengchongensis]QKQ99079.1 formate dehydrogenase accessory sulfurtransferase FdhD [Metallosphaera tengchongensis]